MEKFIMNFISPQKSLMQIDKVHKNLIWGVMGLPELKQYLKMTFQGSQLKGAFCKKRRKMKIDHDLVHLVKLLSPQEQDIKHLTTY